MRRRWRHLEVGLHLLRPKVTDQDYERQSGECFVYLVHARLLDVLVELVASIMFSWVTGQQHKGGSCANLRTAFLPCMSPLSV